MATDAGREAGVALIDEFTPRLAQHHVPLSAYYFVSLHVLFGDPPTKAARLGQVVQHLYNRMNTQPVESTGFVAHYVADETVTAQWLVWITQHWAAIPERERSLAVAAANRPDLVQSNGLPDLLAQRLLDTDDAEPWQHAAPLWNTVTPERQVALLVAANGRCPALASQASTDTILKALDSVGSSELPALLVLICASPQASQAIADYDEIAPVLRDATASSATALGSAVRPAPDIAAALRRTLHGHSKTTREKERTTAFKQAAGIR